MPVPAEARQASARRWNQQMGRNAGNDWLCDQISAPMKPSESTASKTPMIRAQRGQLDLNFIVHE